MKIYNSLTSFLVENIIIAIFSIYFFLWSQSLFFFDERLILVLLIPLYFFIKTNHLDKYSFFFFLILISLIFFHLILNNFFFEKNLFENFDAILGSTLIALIALMYRSFLIKNLSKLIYFFISILVLFFFIEIFFFNNFYNINNFDCLNGWFSNVNLKLFSENSHFGMIAPAIICYMIFQKEKKKPINYLNLILIFFLFLFLSTTLLIGTILCLFIFILTKFKILNNSQKITSVFFLIASLFLAISKPQCNMRLFETIQGIYINYTSNYNENSNLIAKPIPDTAPDYFFSGIKKGEREKFENGILNMDPNASIEIVPIVVASSGIVKINGIDPHTYIKKDNDSYWFISTDRRLSWLENIPKDNPITEGEWWDLSNPDQLQISLDAKVAKDFNIQLGDIFTLNIYGQEIDGKVINFREVNYDDLNTKFEMLFNPQFAKNIPHEYLAFAKFNSNKFDETKMLEIMPSLSIIKIADYLSKIKKDAWKKNLYGGSLNQSSEVTLNSYSVSLNSLMNYPFGVGMNNYIVSYKKFSEDLSLYTWEVNKEDGSNNFSKLLSEFGFFSFVLFLIILNYALRDNEDFFKNTFFYSIIITQLLRGAGYFNGGFLLSVFIILLSLFLKKKNVKKIS